MNPLSRWVLPLLLAALLSSAAFASSTDNNTSTWLDRMNTALRTLNYAGDIVYIHDNNIETMRVTHRADSEGGIERLISLTGPQREVIRNHNEVKSIFPESHSVLIERRYAATHFPGSIPQAVHEDKLLAHYIFKSSGADRIAGHVCKVIDIEPRDDYRYGYRLWLDTSNAMLLRSDLITNDGKTVERVMFTSINYPRQIPDEALKATEIKPGYIWNIQGGRELLNKADTKLDWKATHLPPGFILSMNDAQRLVGAMNPVRHLMFSDGLASVSVFVEAAMPGRKELIGPSSMGAVSAFGRQVGNYNITVVGEVPPETVELIARNIRN
ncbi:MAG: MucB/RseB C-terminal domain-containing protein [Gammaproteobacteria bacterium]